MRYPSYRKVSKTNLEISKKHQELARLYEKRAQMLQVSKKRALGDIDFPDYLIEDLISEVKTSRANKTQRDALQGIIPVKTNNTGRNYSQSRQDYLKSRNDAKERFLQTARVHRSFRLSR